MLLVCYCAIVSVSTIYDEDDLLVCRSHRSDAVKIFRGKGQGGVGSIRVDRGNLDFVVDWDVGF